MRELDYRSLGMRIRQVRKAKGWSQELLAKKCGICMSFLGHIERGSRIMSLETFVSICEALDADAGGLLWGETNPSDAVLNMWNTVEKKPEGNKDKNKNKNRTDSYAAYIRIMKSVAEIMNEA